MDTASSRVNTNGLAAVNPLPTRRKRRRARKPKEKWWQGIDWPRVVKVVMTVALGVGVPLLSLALSKIAGTLAASAPQSEERQEQCLLFGLAGFALGLMVAVLGVSLNHLAWAIENITRSDWRASWALAVALDLNLVLCELVLVYAAKLNLALVAYAVMGCVALASMALNVWAFLMHE